MDGKMDLLTKEQAAAVWEAEAEAKRIEETERQETLFFEYLHQMTRKWIARKEQKENKEREARAALTRQQRRAMSMRRKRNKCVLNAALVTAAGAVACVAAINGMMVWPLAGFFMGWSFAELLDWITLAGKFHDLSREIQNGRG